MRSCVVCDTAMLLLLLSSVDAYSSTLLGTSWRIKLNIGLEQGSWMPRNVEGWGESGARVLVDALVDFDAAPANEPHVARPTWEPLVGPKEGTRLLIARGGGKIVTLAGEQEITFASGGWCVQRSVFTKASEDEGVLRFWLDCPSGVVKNDLSVPPGERIFFSTGVWDEPEGLKVLAAERETVTAQIKAVEDAEAAGVAEDDWLAKVPGIAFRRKLLRQEKMGQLRARRAYLERWPGLGEDHELPALLATEGSLSLKRESQGPLGRVETQYHILGRFSAEPLRTE